MICRVLICASAHVVWSAVACARHQYAPAAKADETLAPSHPHSVTIINFSTKYLNKK